MKSAEFEEIVKRRLFTSATPETIEIVGEFSILYGIFECKFFRRPCGSKPSEVKVEVRFNSNYKKITDCITAGDANAAYQHFRKRYLLDEEKGLSRFESLDLSGGLKNSIRKLIESAKSDSEKRYAVIIIMNALRNNLFHGVKGTDSFNENRENFVVLNSFLLNVLSHA